MNQRCGWTCSPILALAYSTRFRSFEMARKMRQLECVSRSEAFPFLPVSSDLLSSRNHRHASLD
ncbi:hypothetical protein CGRA01v4_11446 [Colletotrichum graminicola]|nr:hypothetical protein CGRA01v4_11446 [Colletotrichum graminicola]